MRQDLSARSWLISRPYCIAMICAIGEYTIEVRALPGMKLQEISYAGLVLILAGEAIRKTAMVTARHNFTHIIQRERRDTHTLITNGIYRHIRHPGYLGFLLWCVGTQLLLVNPVSCITFAVVVWRFFRERIEVEEQHLHDFFAADYAAYARTTPTGIPLIP
ncbi:g6073 [Coccomyxa viridis]|uniref:Protein-S-isoprenylcysteine O-methyltransferase n=1 Tax=Coccomyxa viridis TaxID=1274662 RepID=A0ABP1FVT8_9CHLO